MGYLLFFYVIKELQKMTFFVSRGLKREILMSIQTFLHSASLATALVFTSANATNAAEGPKEATAATKAANKEMVSKLSFNDKESFEDTTRNFIAPLPDKGVIKNAKGKDAWDLPKFDFLAGDKAAPDTVNPSLWRQAQIMQRNAGLFKVTDGIYQVRGSDISNLTVIEGDTGLIIMDTLLSKPTAEASLKLYFEHRPKKPIVAVMNSRSIGGEAVALSALQQVKLDKKFAALGFNRKQISAAIGNIIGRMVQPGSELSTHQWLQERSAPGELLECDYGMQGSPPSIAPPTCCGSATMRLNPFSTSSIAPCLTSKRPSRCLI
jgi:hypothetical protein